MCYNFSRPFSLLLFIRFSICASSPSTLTSSLPLFISLLIIINTVDIERKRNNYCDLDLDLDCDLGLDDGGGGGDGDDDGTLLHRRHHYRYLRRGARRSRRRAPTGTFLITFLLSVR